MWDFIISFTVVSPSQAFRILPAIISAICISTLLFESENFKSDAFIDFYKFEIQPNMVFDISENWHSNDDYVLALSKNSNDLCSSIFCREYQTTHLYNL